ncbi:hypothetical protein HK097_000189 [Rhizophlyctis rosea]|uniref:Methyltransferase domain-containing protein n=1 Tax=Rhizophlyctis rosea TaxID=64517 RepID=A0AAD5SGJ2_9FUNG|nr:hypothetical protein HK097_000189 [Rhizophlyctis rosea]
MDNTAFIAPYVPCHPDVGAAAVSFARVSSQDVLVDLGCGDARVLLSALSSTTPPQRCIGVELDPHLVEHIQSLPEAKPHIDSSTLTILEQDMFKVNLSDLKATAMILYLLPAGLEKLKSQLETWLRDDGGAQKKRIVTITYSITGWEPHHAKQTFLEPGVRKLAPMGGSSGISQWLFYYDVTSIR